MLGGRGQHQLAGDADIRRPGGGGSGRAWGIVHQGRLDRVVPGRRVGVRSRDAERAARARHRARRYRAVAPVDRGREISGHVGCVRIGEGRYRYIGESLTGIAGERAPGSRQHVVLGDVDVA